MSLSDAFAGPNGALLNALLYTEPDVPEDQRQWVAWCNALPVPWADPHNVWRYDQDGRLIYWHDYGKNVLHGWHVHHRRDQALGGRHNAANLVARHWLGNTQAGGLLGALLGGGR
jgi:hypothetical protein